MEGRAFQQLDMHTKILSKKVNILKDAIKSSYKVTAIYKKLTIVTLATQDYEK